MKKLNKQRVKKLQELLSKLECSVDRISTVIELYNLTTNNMKEVVRKLLNDHDNMVQEVKHLYTMEPTHDDLQIHLGNGVFMEMTYIQAKNKTFLMGSPVTEVGRDDNETQHEVEFSNNYWLGTYPVTQEQYQTIMGTNPSHFTRVKRSDLKDTGLRPVEKVSWDDAQLFCQKLSELPDEKEAGRTYRLPTEAEWEYACRAGTTTPYFFGTDPSSLADHAWTKENSAGRTHAVGKKKPNGFGLFDMHGNVWEWCQDWYGSYPQNKVTDPQGPIRGAYRVLRGGSWLTYCWGCRAAVRPRFVPADRDYDCGFRVCL